MNKEDQRYKVVSARLTADDLTILQSKLNDFKEAHAGHVMQVISVQDLLQPQLKAVEVWYRVPVK